MAHLLCALGATAGARVQGRGGGGVVAQERMATTVKDGACSCMCVRDLENGGQAQREPSRACHAHVEGVIPTIGPIASRIVDLVKGMPSEHAVFSLRMMGG